MSKTVIKDFIKVGPRQGSPAIFVTFTSTATGLDITVDEVAELIYAELKTSRSPSGSFIHDQTKLPTWLVLTGEDPMNHQDTVTDLFSKLIKDKVIPPRILIHTEGKTVVSEDFSKFAYDYHVAETYGGFLPDTYGPSLLCFEVTPILGRARWEDCVDIRSLYSYSLIADRSYFLFNHNGSKMRWFEIEKLLETCADNDVEWPVCIHPEEADEEDLDSIFGETYDRGFLLSA